MDSCNLYRVVSKYQTNQNVVSSPKEYVKFRDAVGVVEQTVTTNGVKTLWYHTLPPRF